MRIYIFVLAALAALVLLAAGSCRKGGGGRSLSLVPEPDTSSAKSVASSLEERTDVYAEIAAMDLASRLQRAEEFFGFGGDSIDPSKVTVYFRNGLSVDGLNTSLAAGINADAVPLLSSEEVSSIQQAAVVPEAIADENYLSITRWLAAKVDADIVAESYWMSVKCAALQLKPGQGGLETARWLLSEFPDIVLLVEPGFRGHACSWENPQDTDPDMVDEDPAVGEYCWGAIRLGCPSLWDDPFGGWSGLDGEGVYVAVLDTGLDILDDGHPEFIDRWETPSGHIYDLVNMDGFPEDVNGHGTHVAGLIAANDGSNAPGGGIVGVAFESKVIPIKVLDPALDFNDLMLALDLVIHLVKPVQEGGHGLNIRAVNMSLGAVLPEGSYPAIQEKVSELTQVYNVANIAAIGNEEESYPTQGGSCFYPACYANVIGVGATGWRAGENEPGYSNNWRAHWGGMDPGSSYGPYVDIVAPGKGIKSCYPRNRGNYTVMSGTSMAAPQIAGIFALMAEARPGWTPYQVLSVLKETGHSVGFYGDETSGGIERERKWLPDLDALWHAMAGGGYGLFLRKISEIGLQVINPSVNARIVGELPLAANCHLSRPSIAFGIENPPYGSEAYYAVCEILHRDASENWHHEHLESSNLPSGFQLLPDLELCEKRERIGEQHQNSIHYVMVNADCGAEAQWTSFRVECGQRGELSVEELSPFNPGVGPMGLVEASRCTDGEIPLGNAPMLVVDPGGAAQYCSLLQLFGTTWGIVDNTVPRKGDASYGQESRFASNGPLGLVGSAMEQSERALINGSLNRMVFGGWPEELQFPECADFQLLLSFFGENSTGRLHCWTTREEGGARSWTEKVFDRNALGGWAFIGDGNTANGEDVNPRIGLGHLPLPGSHYRFVSRTYCAGNMLVIGYDYPGVSTWVDSQDWDHTALAPSMCSDSCTRAYLAMVKLDGQDGPQRIIVYETGVSYTAAQP